MKKLRPVFWKTMIALLCLTLSICCEQGLKFEVTPINIRSSRLWIYWSLIHDSTIQKATDKYPISIMFDVRRRYRAVVTYKLKKMQFYVYQKWIEYNSICYFQNINFKVNRKKQINKTVFRTQLPSSEL